MIIFVIIAAILILQEGYIAHHISERRLQYIRQHGIDEKLIPSFSNRCFKRLEDILLSFLICLCVLPIMYLIFGLIIKLTSAGPIIFKQKRMGLFGKEFMCYKFRSMYVGADDRIAMSSDDERITKVGRWLRKTHIDEFPQFFNVLKGDMSLVGPRPSPKAEFEKFADKDKAYGRLLLRPGVTGLAQINSGRFLSKEECLQYDLMYKPSLIKDLFIILKTLTFSDVTC